MAADEIHVGDVGTVIERTVTEGGAAVDISTATLKQIVLTKPDGTTLTKTAVFATDGTDGKVRYTTITGDLSLAGQWALQVYLEMPAGKWHSDVSRFDVYANLS